MGLHKDYLDILRSNGGFHPEEQWLEYAKIHNFEKTSSIKLSKCPDCGNDDLINFGQYIYYSNLCRLKFCSNCGLYFSDTLLEPEVINNHFENTYNDESYFSIQRKKIFEYVASLVNKHTPENGNVIDIGGGKGHVLSIVKTLRPDIHLTLNDLSKKSCNYCNETYSIKSICCDIPHLQELNLKFNTILLIDVIYYEPKLNEMFNTVDKLLYPDEGNLVIRVPNKLRMIKAYQYLLNSLAPKPNKMFQSSVKFFNPEHIYIFSKRYLDNKLKKHGFSKVAFVPSPLLDEQKGKMKLLGTTFFKVANIICRVTLGKVILTPSMIVIATK